MELHILALAIHMMKIMYTYRPECYTSIQAARATGCFTSLNNWKKLLISFKLCLFVPSSYYTKWVGKKSGIPLNVDMYYVLGNGVISLKILPQAQIMLYIIYWVSIWTTIWLSVCNVEFFMWLWEKNGVLSLIRPFYYQIS